MNGRVVLGWVEDQLRSVWAGDDLDLDDWLVGNDEAVTERANDRRMSTVAGLGVEVR